MDECYDPCCRDRKISVVDMGLIESIEIRDREVRIDMVLTTGWCPFAARLLDMIKEKVGNLPTVDAELVWDPPWTPEGMGEEGAGRDAPREVSPSGAAFEKYLERRAELGLPVSPEALLVVDPDGERGPQEAVVEHLRFARTVRVSI